MKGITRKANTDKKPLFVIAKTNQSCPLARQRKKHTKNDKDNITSRIKTFFLNSIIIFINKNIKSYFGSQIYKLRKINSKFKYNAKVSENYNKKVFKTKIRILFYKSISTKYRGTPKNRNKQNIKKLEKVSFFKKLFQIKYWKFYTYLFLSDKYEIINKCFSNGDEKTAECMKIKMKNLKDLQEKLKNNNDEKYIKEVENVAYKLEHKFRLKSSVVVINQQN
jgi:hypothetical protein